DYGPALSPQHFCHYPPQAAGARAFLNARRHPLCGRRVAVRHCDVKPSNLLVLDGKVKLADFSLAAQVTSPMWYHHRVGTLAYTAPEMLQGWLSDRTDQFALAITYCELRGGRRPSPDPPPAAGTDCGRRAPDLAMLTAAEARVIARGLAPVPQDRWPTCTEMMDRLRGCAGEAKARV